MTATVTATVDSIYRRVGVQLSGWTSADGPVSVTRVHADTSEWPVRATASTSAGQTFMWDYEAPFRQPVTYYAMDGSNKVVSAATTLSFDEQWLRVPGFPIDDLQLHVVEKPAVTRSKPEAKLRPLGRATPIVLSGTRSAPEFTLRVRTTTDDDADNLVQAISDGSTFLLLIPGTRTAWQYVTVSDVVETPVVPYRAQTPGDEGEWAIWDLPCTVVDRPIGGIFGDPTASYGAIAATYSTYAALRSAKATYLDVLKGA